MAKDYNTLRRSLARSVTKTCTWTSVSGAKAVVTKLSNDITMITGTHPARNGAMMRAAV